MLFLDELPEFSRPVLEALREPLGTGQITIARSLRTVEYPAEFQLVAAMNPCPCGYAGDREQECRCTPDQIRRYQMKVSGPLLDRVDLVVSVNRGGLRRGDGARAEPSAPVRARVAGAVERQVRRSGCLNGRLPPTACAPTAPSTPRARPCSKPPAAGLRCRPGPRTAFAAWRARWPTWPGAT